MPEPGDSKGTRVIAHLRGMVAEGRMKQGDRFPSERILAQDLKISRAVVREALSALELSGDVERRTGDGSYLAVAPENFGESSSIRMAAGLDLVDAMELRMDLEIAAAALACSRARRSDILRLEAGVEAMSEYLEEEDYEAYLDASMDVHVAIGRAAHSRPLADSQTEITETARCDEWLLAEHYTPEIAQTSFEEHSAIVQAISARDVAAAVEAVKRHYENYPTFTKLDHVER